MNGMGVPDVSAATSRTSSPASAGSASRTDRMAPMTSHTSGPPTSLALRPAGPSLNVMSGCSRIRSASSTSLLVALDRVRSRCAATNAESRSNTRGSNRTDDGLGVATMYDNVGECRRQCKRLACCPGTGVEPGSVVSRGGSAARGDQEHVGYPLPRPTRQVLMPADRRGGPAKAPRRRGGARAPWPPDSPAAGQRRQPRHPAKGQAIARKERTRGGIPPGGCCVGTPRQLPELGQIQADPVDQPVTAARQHHRPAAAARWPLRIEKLSQSANVRLDFLNSAARRAFTPQHVDDNVPGNPGGPVQRQQPKHRSLPWRSEPDGGSGAHRRQRT